MGIHPFGKRCQRHLLISYLCQNQFFLITNTFWESIPSGLDSTHKLNLVPDNIATDVLMILRKL